MQLFYGAYSNATVQLPVGKQWQAAHLSLGSHGAFFSFGVMVSNSDEEFALMFLNSDSNY